jgi:hypothetical protein
VCKKFTDPSTNFLCSKTVLNYNLTIVTSIYRVHASLLLDEVSVVPDDVDIIVAFWYESDGRVDKQYVCKKFTDPSTNFLCSKTLLNYNLTIVTSIYRVHASWLLDEVSFVPDDVDIIVAFWYERDGRVELPDLMYSRAGNPTFEKRFVETLDTPDTRGNMNRWSGMCYYRHGGHMFPGWWKQCRNDCGASK